MSSAVLLLASAIRNSHGEWNSYPSFTHQPWLWYFQEQGAALILDWDLGSTEDTWEADTFFTPGMMEAWELYMITRTDKRCTTGPISLHVLIYHDCSAAPFWCLSSLISLPCPKREDFRWCACDLCWGFCGIFKLWSFTGYREHGENDEMNSQPQGIRLLQAHPSFMVKGALHREQARRTLWTG